MDGRRCAARATAFFHFTFDDPARTQIYVSSTSGEVVLWTTASQRFWNWFGAIPHWLYFTQLRKQRSAMGADRDLDLHSRRLFDHARALSRDRAIPARQEWPRFPYRGWFYWHHIAGLIFGVLTLTWVVSGTLSMNPWGFLEGGGGDERTRLAGEPIAWSTVRDSLSAMKQQPTC